MNHQLIPLNDKEEAILQLMQRVNELEYENSNLKEEIKQLKWSLQEHD
jgi:predicted RNase H-like nuclease (RuvC/YqgF family)